MNSTELEKESQNCLKFIVPHNNLSSIVNDELFHEFTHKIIINETNVILILYINKEINVDKLCKFINLHAEFLNT